MLSFFERSKISWLNMVWRFFRVSNQLSSREIGKRLSYESKNIAVLVSPWGNTQVPFYSLFLASVLRRRGAKVTLFLDKLNWGQEPIWRSVQQFVLEAVSRILKFHVVPVDKKSRVGGRTALSCPLGISPDRGTVFDVYRLGCIHRNKGESQLSTSLVRDEGFLNQLVDMVSPIEVTLRAGSYDFVLAPGGISQSTGIFRLVCERLGIRFSTFDSGDGVLLACSDGVAAQLSDVRRAVNLCSEYSPSIINEICSKFCDAEITRRINGRDAWSTQIATSKLTYTVEGNKYAVIFLNVPWDSASLGRHKFFGTSIEWVKFTVRYLLDNTDFVVVVRQHPIERYDFAKSVDDYSSILKEEFGSTDRIVFISCNEAVNSYDLIRDASFIVTYTSTVALEAILAGKVTINVSRNYYSNCGITFDPENLDEYRSYLSFASRGDLLVSEQQVFSARRFYYFSQKYNWIFTNYSPNKFLQAEKFTMSELEDLIVVVDALIEDVPIPFSRFIKDYPLSEDK